MTTPNDSLGSITKFASTPEYLGSRATKFYLLALAKRFTPNHRVAICYHHRLPQTASIDLVHVQDTDTGKDRVSIRGTMKCSSIWVCAVCAARVSEGRRIELSDALQGSKNRFVWLLITYTMRHSANQPLAANLDALNSAYRKLRSGRLWQTLKDEYCMVGSVRSSEMTYGQNGWHPHFHELLLLDKSILDAGTFDEIADSLQRQLAARWMDALTSVGADATLEHGVDVSTRPGDIAAYIAKYGRMPRDDGQWTESHELTKATSKRSALDGLTPFQILAAAKDSAAARRLWREYVDATKGRAMLVWSRGTKALLGLDNLADEDIPGIEDDESAIVLASFTPEQWHYVNKHNAVVGLIQAAERHDLDKIWAIHQWAANGIQGIDNGRCAKHGIPITDDHCPICEWEQSDYGANHRI